MLFFLISSCLHLLLLSPVEICLIAVLDGPFSLNVAGGGYHRNIKFNAQQKQIIANFDDVIKSINQDPANVDDQLSDPPSSPHSLYDELERIRQLHYEVYEYLSNQKKSPFVGERKLKSVVSEEVVRRGFEVERNARSLSHAYVGKAVPLNAEKDPDRNFFG